MLNLPSTRRPTRYLPVNHLPLNPQGKLDRAALAALVPDDDSETVYTDTTGRLAE